MDGMEETDTTKKWIVMTAEIVSAFTRNNTVAQADLPKLIQATYRALTEDADPAPQTVNDNSSLKSTAAAIRRSITFDALISFEDGKPYKTLKRHLAVRGLTPHAYRLKWGLPIDYPIISAAYSEKRSELAKSLGLGARMRRKAKDKPKLNKPNKPSKTSKAAK